MLNRRLLNKLGQPSDKTMTHQAKKIPNMTDLVNHYQRRNLEIRQCRISTGCQPPHPRNWHTRKIAKLSPLERQAKTNRKNSTSTKQLKSSFKQDLKKSHHSSLINVMKHSDKREMEENVNLQTLNNHEIVDVNCKMKKVADKAFNCQDSNNVLQKHPLINEQQCSTTDNIQKPQRTQMSKSEYSKQLKTRKQFARKVQREKAELFNIDLVDLHKTMITSSATKRGLVKLNASEVIIYRFRLSNYDLIDIQD